MGHGRRLTWIGSGAAAIAGLIGLLAASSGRWPGGASTGLRRTSTASAPRGVSGAAAPRSSDEAEEQRVAVALIGPTGGELRGPGVTVRFPVGALERETRITARRVAEFPAGSPGPVYDLGPSGSRFAHSPEIAIALPEHVCMSKGRWTLGTIEHGRWHSLPGSRLERDPCRVVGETAHFSHFGPLAAALPLSQPVQNYFVEAILSGAYHHTAAAWFREFRSDGLLTRGTSRFLADPVICLIGREDQPELRAAVQALLTDAVATLTDDNLSAVFAPAGCFVPSPIDPCPIDCAAVTPGQIHVFLEPTVGCGYRGVACYADGDIGLVRGGEITGGILRAGSLASTLPIGATDEQTIRHELGHVFGLSHTWGDEDIMSYTNRPSSLTDFAPHERDAFAVLYQLGVGLGLRDLVAAGVIQDTPAVLDEAPQIDHTEISHGGVGPGGDRTGSPADRDHGAVDENVYLMGQRLTLAFQKEFPAGLLPFGYAPPVVHFGPVSVVADLSAPYQTVPVQWFGWPTGILKVRIPPGAGAPLGLTTRGQSVSLPSFAVDGPAVPLPSQTPLPVSSFTCDRPPASSGHGVLGWTLPATYADGATPLASGGVTARVYRNGLLAVELAGAATTWTDPTLHPDFESDLYQVILVDGSSGQAGVPSPICALPPRRADGEVTTFVLDRTGSMAQLRADGTTRFEAMVGPLPAPQVPRAFAALDEVFHAALPPRVAVYSFNHADGLVDEVNLLAGTTFTSDQSVAEAALLAVRARGPVGSTPLVDSVCVSAADLVTALAAGGSAATLRLFTDGEENFSVGVAACPPSCAGGSPGTVPWDHACIPGSCPGASPTLAPSSCTTCQTDLFQQYCATVANFFVEYFGPGGPFSPLPPDAAYLMALASATEGRFTWNADDGRVVREGVPGDLPPIADEGEDEVVDCLGPGASSLQVTLSGRAADELPEAQLQFTWTGPFPEGGGVVHGPRPVVTLTEGWHLITLYVSDHHVTGAPAFLGVTVARDLRPPELSVSLTPAELWPPDHQLRPITAAVRVRDQCDPAPSVRLVSIVSSEPEDLVPGPGKPRPGDGHTGPDIVGAAPGTDDREFALRAERVAGGPGRTYVATYQTTDAAGNVATASAAVRVPSSRRP